MTNNKSARDWAIFMNINDERYSDVERMTAIEHIAYAPTHNSITKAMMLDVIRYLLTAKQPRVLTKEEIVGYNGYIWKEYRNMKPMKGVFINHGIEQIPYEGDFATKDYGWPTYQKLWRCWSAQPTEEQRETAPWNEPPKEGGSK